jgi:hypothetical protein
MALDDMCRGVVSSNPPGKHILYLENSFYLEDRFVLENTLYLTPLVNTSRCKEKIKKHKDTKKETQTHVVSQLAQVCNAADLFLLQIFPFHTEQAKKVASKHT